MELLIALGFIAGVVFLVSRLKPGTDADAPFADLSDEPEWEPYERPGVPVDEPPPVVGKVPDGWVVLRDSLRAPEATVTQGLLRSHGVESVLTPWSTSGPGVNEYGGTARWYSLSVAAEDAAEAAELLDRSGSG